jgi:hypothetical protein
MNADLFFHIALYIPIPLLVNYLVATKLILSNYFWSLRLELDYNVSVAQNSKLTYIKYFSYKDGRAKVITGNGNWSKLALLKQQMKHYDIYIHKKDFPGISTYGYNSRKNKLVEISHRKFFCLEKCALIERYSLDYWKGINPYWIFYFDPTPYLDQIMINKKFISEITIFSWFIDWRGNRISLFFSVTIRENLHAHREWSLTNLTLNNDRIYWEAAAVNLGIENACVLFAII